MRAGPRRVLRALLVLAALAGCQPGESSNAVAPPPAAVPEHRAGAGAGAPFDYWILALSWSPEYCASREARPGSRQCAMPREFVVHGLWPQFERGYPAFCDSRRRVDERIAERLAPLMPDRGLVFHQWKKHGSCSGLQPEGYFAALERAARAVTVPSAALREATPHRAARERIEDAFVRANPGLTREAITFHCRSDFLREVRICLDLDLRPRACGADVREACGRSLSVRRGAP